MKRVANLYRVSTKKQVDLVKDDIPMQRIACREFAERQGWTVVIEKEEKGISGFKVSASKRDAIQELKDSALKGEFDVLLVFMFDRLGRIENETPFILEWFTEHGIEVWSVNEGQQKIETHSDKLMNYIRFWQASGESEKTAIRVRTRLQQMTAEGVYTGGPVPFGYRLVDNGRVCAGSCDRSGDSFGCFETVYDGCGRRIWVSPACRMVKPSGIQDIDRFKVPFQQCPQNPEK